MSSQLSFVVTTPATEITLDGRRHGEFAVSITNTAGRPLRARLQLVPAPPAEPGWFGVAGGDERDLALGATQSFSVQVQAPPTAAPGSYQVRCDAIDEAQPQEVFTIGPTVAVQLSTAAARRGRIPWWVFAAAAAVVLIAAIAFFVLRGSDTEVPNVLDIPASEAIRALENSGVDPEPPDVVNPQCDPPVLTQDPAGGEVVDEGTTVQLTFDQCRNVSSVPNFVGLRASQMNPAAALIAAKLEVLQVGESDTCDPTATNQFPRAGIRTNFGGTVVVTIPSEPDGCNNVSVLPPADETRRALFD